MKKNVAIGYLGLEKPDPKQLSESCDIYKGDDFFLLNSPIVNGFKIVLDGQISKDTTPMYKVQIKKVEVIGWKPEPEEI